MSPHRSDVIHEYERLSVERRLTMGDQLEAMECFAGLRLIGFLIRWTFKGHALLIMSVSIASAVAIVDVCLAGR